MSTHFKPKQHSVRLHPILAELVKETHGYFFSELINDLLQEHFENKGLLRVRRDGTLERIADTGDIL